MGDIDYAVTPISELEAFFDSPSDIEMIAESEDIGNDSALVTGSREPDDIKIDSTSITEARSPHDISTESVLITDMTSPPRALEQEVLSQTALGKHLFKASEKVVANQRKKGKESFAAWSRDRDPDGQAWTWEGDGGRGHPYRYKRSE